MLNGEHAEGRGLLLKRTAHEMRRISKPCHEGGGGVRKNVLSGGEIAKGLLDTGCIHFG